ncbi:MAG: hypothetical protein CM15mP109_04400 [Candidatus Dadabacteria bacterium]|nr:MAG: hypothetical protein CM15mP109_04400 [Candidatus Dadabacteria bacterium]
MLLKNPPVLKPFFLNEFGKKQIYGEVLSPENEDNYFPVLWGLVVPCASVHGQIVLGSKIF